MATIIPAERLTLNLSRLVAKSNNDEVQFAAESLSERENKGNPRQPHDPFGPMQLQIEQNQDLSLLWNMHQHSLGRLGENFFNVTAVPRAHENKAIHEVYSLFHKIKENRNPQDLIRLKDLTEKVAKEIFQVHFNHESPELQRSVPTPNSSERSTYTPPLVRRNAVYEIAITENNQELSETKTSTT